MQDFEPHYENLRGLVIAQMLEKRWADGHGGQ
jgi:hypothetical protein